MELHFFVHSQKGNHRIPFLYPLIYIFVFRSNIYIPMYISSDPNQASGNVRDRFLAGTIIEKKLPNSMAVTSRAMTDIDII